ncbi:MAG: glycosyltransferase [Phycisphaeraceae bacterium]|nr:glycosyltransferase [Phycisphaeraceae bacterium]
MITYVVPTRNRPDVLRETLRGIEALGDHARSGGAEVIVVDNASEPAANVPRALANGVTIDLVRRTQNEGASARNFAALHADPASDWIVMLDDDSYPLDLNFVESLQGQPRDVGAVSADIFLGASPEAITGREQGGLPEVFIGCGVAIRRSLFVALGGYDHRFNYYAEEYDLAARILLAGYRVVFDQSFRVLHRKVTTGRDMNTILSRLVRNNGWVMQRYAPEPVRREQIRSMRQRYRQIAEMENALSGFSIGLRELARTIGRQPRTPMSMELWKRFTGRAAVREGLAWNLALRGVRSAALVEEGKNAPEIRAAMCELGIAEVPPDRAEALVVGTLSPGPMLDAQERLAHDPRVVTPWRVGNQASALPRAA